MLSDNIIAFVHIEKAAGSSLIALLRYNFPFTHCEVKPLSKDLSHVFSACDMEKILKINPWVKSISGHSLTPVSNLRLAYPNIQYITLLRDPVKRYISNYLYWVDAMGYKGNFQTYLGVEKIWNFQVKKIAGVEDLEVARKIVDKEFFLVGLTEEFASFLLLLGKKMSKTQFKLINFHINEGRKSQNYEGLMKDLNPHLPGIEKRNALDIELYNHVKGKWTKEKENYGPSFSADLESLKQRDWRLRSYGRYANFLYRNLYYKQMIAFLRIASGRKARGGY